MRRIFVGLILFVPLFSFAQIESLKDPRARGQWVEDTAHLLSEGDRASINAMIEDHWQKTKNEIILVTVPSIGQQVPKDFAVKLFQSWKIGRAKIDDGLLILMVNDQRRLEFEVGYGLEGILPDITCKRIQTEYMVPFFRKNDWAGGLNAGVTRVIGILKGETFALPAAQRVTSLEDRIFDYFIMGSICFAFLVAILGLLAPLWARYKRRRPRACASCRQPMRLSEDPAEETKYLNDQQAWEEHLQSEDYDVWLCPSGHVEIGKYSGLKKSEYVKCPKCQTEAAQFVSRQNSGWFNEQIFYKCVACDYAYNVIVKKQSSGSSSSGGGGGGSGGSRSTGGGRSGGGGAGSSY